MARPGLAVFRSSWHADGIELGRRFAVVARTNTSKITTGQYVATPTQTLHALALVSDEAVAALSASSRPTPAPSSDRSGARRTLRKI